MPEPVTVLDQLRKARPTISVGMLTADLMNLGRELGAIQEAGVKVLHFDVMDGHFCPSITVGPQLVKGVKSSLLKDVHLMIEKPEDNVEAFVNAGADIVTVHAEGCRHPHRALQALGAMKNANNPERGIVRGLGLNPGTPLETIEPLLPELEMIVLLGVNPGWSGQKYIASTDSRVARVRRMAQDAGCDPIVCVDGGITRQNIAAIAALGADLVVTGSAVFDGKDPKGNAKFMLDALKRS